uniref:Chromophore lyase CpcS/CpeS n=1 Tax=Gronococcus sybilensis TaxID=3028029 RepID=A0A9Y1I2L5_9RHOD|nr:phycobiliprotein lyase [Gronococcus sybilensis]
MELKKFIQNLEGKWFVQRTSHIACSGESQTVRGDALVNLNNFGRGKIVSPFKPEECPVSLKLNHYSCGNCLYSSMLIFLPIKEMQDSAKVMKLSEKNELIIGHCCIDKLGTMHISFSYEDNFIEERIWFASKNLKLTITIINKQGVLQYSSFASEIRLR